jgi:predicted dienelactone hydrolase
MRALVALFALAISVPLARADYDPLKVDSAKPEFHDFTVKDAKRTRDIPIRVYLPKGTGPAPVVLFSHGLGGNREGPAYLGAHWSARGYAVVFVQHPGSDDSVWKDVPAAKRMAAMQKAASTDNLLLRVADVPAVLDQLERWVKEDAHALKGRLELKKVGMSGHSFGAITTQAVSGQSAAVGKGATDARVAAAVLMSPSPPKLGDPKRAFGDVKIPWLLLTGTKDEGLIGGFAPKDRLAVFPALPPGAKYELVFDKAEHSAFGDRALPGETEKRNPNHHKAILATTTAFWDAHLRGASDAKTWIESADAVRKVLEKADAWQKK